MNIKLHFRCLLHSFKLPPRKIVLTQVMCLACSSHENTKGRRTALCHYLSSQVNEIKKLFYNSGKKNRVSYYLIYIFNEIILNSFDFFFKSIPSSYIFIFIWNVVFFIVFSWQFNCFFSSRYPLFLIKFNNHET